MAAAAGMGEPHGMLSVVGLADEKLSDICAEVKKALGGDTVCQLANYLFPQGRVISGHKVPTSTRGWRAVALASW